jgi:hypothetical protein
MVRWAIILRAGASEDFGGSASKMETDDKIVLITGSTDGVGRYGATRLAMAGARAQTRAHGPAGGLT